MDQSLGPAMEEALLSVLVALGVMHAPKEQVLVLPLQSEALREVIFFRYVGSAEARDTWHLRIARYFNRQPSSLRRSEELP